MENNQKSFWLIFSLLFSLSCESQQKKYESPPGFDFAHPVRYVMPTKLNEISGIALNSGHADTIYAEQDEDGKVFHFKLGDDQFPETRFGKKGDYEDISVCGQWVIVLRSDGVFFVFPLSETRNTKTDQTRVFEGLLPAGEYEGLAFMESTGKLYVLCKHCSNEKTSKEGLGYIFQLKADGTLSAAGQFEIKVKDIDAATDVKKINFHPSALANNPLTGEWYVLSSVNRMLVVTYPDWNIKKVYRLNGKNFPQPEGMTFDRSGNLYISNERNQTTAASVLLFKYQKN